MLILLIATSAYAEDTDVYSWSIPDYGKQAQRAAEIRKDNAIADYLNRQPAQYGNPIYVQPPAQIPAYVVPNFNQAPAYVPPVYPNAVGVYGNPARPW